VSAGSSRRRALAAPRRQPSRWIGPGSAPLTEPVAHTDNKALGRQARTRGGLQGGHADRPFGFAGGFPKSAGGLISRTRRAMVTAKTASLNATNRLVSRDTERGSAPASPSSASAVVSQRTERITEETTCRIAEGDADCLPARPCLSAGGLPQRRGRFAGPADRTGSLTHRSSTTFSCGCEQQTSALPSAGASTGSGL
jgi:hypothetical protein